MDRKALSLYLEAHTPCTMHYSVRHGQGGPLVVLGSPHALHRELLSQAWTGRLSRCTWKPTHPAPCTTQSGMDRKLSHYAWRPTHPILCTTQSDPLHGSTSWVLVEAEDWCLEGHTPCATCFDQTNPVANTAYQLMLAEAEDDTPKAVLYKTILCISHANDKDLALGEQ